MIYFNKEQKFIVTGAASGIGKGVALRLNELGASVIAVDINLQGLLLLQKEVRFTNNLYIEQKDLEDDIGDLPKYVKSLKEKYGKFQGFVSCAGTSRLSPLQSLEFEDIKQLFNINFFAHIMLLKGFTDKRNNVGKGSSFVSISSAAKEIAPRGKSAFSAGISALTTAIKCVAKEVAPYGIRVNSVSPTDIATPLTTSLSDAVRPDYPMGMGEVSDVANLVVFLLSDQAKWITAQDYIVDCGSF